MLSIAKLVRIVLPVTVRGLTYDTPMLYVQGAAASAAYAAGDAVGQQFEVPLPDRVRSGVLHRAVMMDRAKQAAAMDLEFFRAPITQVADNAAFTIADAEHPTHLGTVSLTVWQSYANEASATGLALAFSFALGPSEKLICQVVTRGTPTLVADRDLGLAFGLLLDAVG